MIVRLKLNPKLDGAVWLHQYRGPKQRTLEHHRELEFNFVIRGTATYLVNQQKYVLLRNSQIWLFPRQEHVLLNESDDCEMWIVVFRPRLLQRLCREPVFRALAKPEPVPDFCRRLTTEAALQLDMLLRGIVQGESMPPLFNSGLAYTLQKAWLLSSEERPLEPVSPVHPCVERAAQLLQREDIQMTTKEICRSSGLSRSRLRRLFKRQTGMAMHEYRNRVMTDRFLRLYADGRKKMLGAALEAGFGSYAQFYRVFTRELGSPPAKYFKKTST